MSDGMGGKIIGLKSLVNDEGGKEGSRNENEASRSEVFVKSSDKCSMVRQFLCLIYLFTSVVGTKEGKKSIGLVESNGMMMDGNFRVFKSESLDAIESNTSANLSWKENCMQNNVIKFEFIEMNVVMGNNESVIERNNDKCTNTYINKNMNSDEINNNSHKNNNNNS